MQGLFKKKFLSEEDLCLSDLTPDFLYTRTFKPKDVKPLSPGHPASQPQTQVCAILNAVLFLQHHTPSLFFSVL